MKTLTIHPGDNVAVVLSGGDVPPGHKIALRDIAAGENILKYGFPIGHALENISAGTHVHVHNCKTNLSGTLEYTYTPMVWPETPPMRGVFEGYVRTDGSAGIRNELWILPTAGCVNKTAEALARESGRRLGGRTDGVYAYPHPYGCSQLGGDHLRTQTTLAALARHPNAGGVLVLGLGCENNGIADFQRVLGTWDERRVRFLNAQEVSDEISAGLMLLDELAAYAEGFRRQPVGLEKLVVGLKCGGSDGLSGVTANPLLGRFSDRLGQYGGSTVLTEVPEMFGAETLLMNRCETRALFDRTVEMVNGFKEYFLRYGQPVYENPSPGNKAGGLTTLEDKSLGCTQKGGNGPVRAVLRPGEAVKTPGLNLLSGPGNDMVAVTELTAAGAQLILFTTGRGTPLGGPVPTVKLSSNTALAQNKPGWIDFDAGVLLDGESMDELTDKLWAQVMAAASGRQKTRNEQNGYREIAIFKDGVTL